MTLEQPQIAHGQKSVVTVDKSKIIERIKKYYGFKTNRQFAVFLGVSPQAISGWIKRNTIDYDLIFSKCHDMSIDMMIRGFANKHEDTSKEEFTDSSDNETKTKKLAIDMLRGIRMNDQEPNWEQRRYEIAKEYCCSRFNNTSTTFEEDARTAVKCADILITKLKQE